MINNNSIYVGIIDEINSSNIVDCCVEKMKQEYDVMVGFFSRGNTDYYDIFKFCSNNTLPILFIDGKYSSNVDDIDIITTKELLKNYDFLYTENFDIVMMNEKTCTYIKDNLYNSIRDKDYINTLKEILRYLNKKGLNIDKIVL